MEVQTVRGRFIIYVWFVRLKWFILQTLAAVALIIFLVWLSIFLYGTFYYIYMPAVAHEWPVHLRFRTDCDEDGRLCSFPMANISMIKSDQKQVLVQGQAYVVRLEMEMPESAINQNLGMFMVHISFYTRNGDIVYTSARSAMLQYKSFIHRTVETVFFLPSLLFRSFTQKQTIATELCNNYFEDPYQPTYGAVIEVQNKKVEIYSMSLKIHARFSGLRYLLFYWPTLSAVVGITSNFFFLSIIALFSWLTIFANTTSDLHAKPSSKKAPESIPIIDSKTTDTKSVQDAFCVPETLTSHEVNIPSHKGAKLVTEDKSSATVRKRKF